MFVFFTSLVSCLFIQKHEERSFVSWMRQNNLIYTGDEYHLRLGIFLTNQRFIKSFKGSFKIGLNKFAATTPSEYRSLLGMNPSLSRQTERKSFVYQADPPKQLDWRQKGAVNEVQNQGNCGSCWAFAAICGMEGAWAVANGVLYKLSEQNLVDCTTTALGCSGGLAELGLDQARRTQDGKFMLEEDYPYLAYQQRVCNFDATKAVAHITDITMYRDEKDLMGVVATYGPTSIGIDASGSLFSFYSSGIYDGSDCQKQQNHAVATVGYGDENGVPYWIVKNSWGKEWGDQGYIRMLRDVDVCGIGVTITGITGL